jgi:hypothetical protein
MQLALVPVALAIVAVSLSGCGTVCNFAAAIVPPDKDPDGWPRVYGGLQFDALMLENANGFHPHSPIGGGGTSGALMFAILLGAPLAEGVATLVGDTLTLPITVPLDMVRYPEKYQKPKEPPPVEVIYDGPPQYSPNGARADDTTLPSEPGKP